MKLAPINFPGKAVMINLDDVEGHLTLGEINDENALTIYVDEYHVHNANQEDQVLVMGPRPNSGEPNIYPHFTAKDTTRGDQKWIVNSDGTISPQLNPDMVLGTLDQQSV